MIEKEDRETVITFKATDDVVSIYSTMKPIVAKLRQKGYKAKQVDKDTKGSVVGVWFDVPIGDFKLPSPRKVRKSNVSSK